MSQKQTGIYYLRKEPHGITLSEIKKTDGTVTPERKGMVEDRAVYKHHNFSRFYRGPFNGIDGKYQGMKLYTCKTLKRILELRKSTYESCGEWFDVYDENGKVNITESLAQ